MKRLVIGTAGHIDHGKTALVRALTGVDTDRLKQEKERGITIELGFTHLVLPGGEDAGFVDVPGHERFVRSMIAGAWGIDLVLLVVAADEGVMPQTREHLDICQLLGVKSGIIVVTKVDLVDEEMAELAAEDAREAVAGTFLDGAPVVFFSAVTGQGKDELLQAMAKAVPESSRSTGGRFRMPIDRVFTMRGFGTVVTGTAATGEIHVGDTVIIQPDRRKAKVRGIQVHGQDVEKALAGQRTAVNLQGVDKKDIARGEVLAAVGAVEPTWMIDVEYHHLSSAPEKFRPKRIRFLAGTSEVVGTLHLVDAEWATPGQTHLAQIRLEEPVAVRPEDRYVVRTYSPMITVGGGRVLDPHPPKHRKKDQSVAEQLRHLVDASPAERALALTARAGSAGIGQTEMLLRLPPADEGDAQSVLDALAKSRKIVALPGTPPAWVERAAFDAIAAAATAAVKAFHREKPAEPGMPRGTLTTAMVAAAGLGGPEATARMDRLLKAVEGAGTLTAEAGIVRLPSHQASVSGELATLRDDVSRAFEAGGLTPPSPDEVARNLKLPLPRLKEVLALLVREGTLVRAKEDLYFHATPLEKIQRELVEYLQEHERITTLEFKAMAGVSRKYMIPLLEHFDATKVTMRVGDERVLRRGAG